MIDFGPVFRALYAFMWVLFVIEGVSFLVSFAGLFVRDFL